MPLAGRALDGEDDEVATDLGAAGPDFIIDKLLCRTLLSSRGTVLVAIALCSHSSPLKLIAMNKEDLLRTTVIFHSDVKCEPVKAHGFVTHADCSACTCSVFAVQDRCAVFV